MWLSNLKGFKYKILKDLKEDSSTNLQKLELYVRVTHSFPRECKIQDGPDLELLIH